MHWRQRRERILLRTLARNLHSYPSGFDSFAAAVQRSGVSLEEIQRFIDKGRTTNWEGMAAALAGPRSRLTGENLERVAHDLGYTVPLGSRPPPRPPIVGPPPTKIYE